MLYLHLPLLLVLKGAEGTEGGGGKEGGQARVKGTERGKFKPPDPPYFLPHIVLSSYRIVF